MTFLTPSLLMGGVELWFHALVKYCDPALVRWTTVCIWPNVVEPWVVERLKPYADVYLGTEVLPTLLEKTEVVVAWGLPELPHLVRGFRGPIVSVSHGCGEWCRGYLRSSRPVATHYAAVSRPAAAVIECNDIRVIPGGVDPHRCTPDRERAQTRAEWGLDRDEFAVGYVGRFSPEKNLPVIAEAIRRLGTRFRGVFVGKDYHSQIDRDVQAILPAAVIVPPTFCVGNVLSALDALVVASAEEGGPLVALEAMYCGCPVASTPVGILPELIQEHGQIATIVPLPPTPEGIAEAIREATLPSVVDQVTRAGQLVRSRHLAPHIAREWSEYLVTIASL